MNAKEVDRLRMLAREDQYEAEARALIQSPSLRRRLVGRACLIMLGWAMAINRRRKARRL
jgi:hypothetical protein